MPPTWTGISSIYWIALEVIEWASSIYFHSFTYIFPKMEASHAKLPVCRWHMPDGHGESTRAQYSKSRCCLQLVAPETAMAIQSAWGGPRSVDQRLVFISKLNFDPSLLNLMTTFLQWPSVPGALSRPGSRECNFLVRFRHRPLCGFGIALHTVPKSQASSSTPLVDLLLWLKD